MNEDFVSFSLAKKLKEKGYPQTPDNMGCMPYYEYDDVANHSALCNEIVWHMSSEPRDNIFAAPAIHKILKWLREEENLHVCISFSDNIGALWEYDVVLLDGAIYRASNDGFVSYEEAALAGIEYVIDNLI